MINNIIYYGNTMDIIIFAGNHQKNSQHYIRKIRTGLTTNEICDKIYNNNESLLNKILVDNYIFLELLDNPYELGNNVLDVTKKYISKLNENNRDLSSFINNLNMYINKIRLIDNVFNKMNSLLTYNLFNSLLYCYFNELQQLNVINNLLEYFKTSIVDIYNFIDAITSCCYDDRLINITNSIILPILTNIDILKEILSYVDKLIVDMKDGNDSKIRNYITLICKSDQNYIFNTFYKKFAEERMLNRKTNLNYELELLNILPSTEVKLKQDITNMVKDMEKTDFNVSSYSRLRVTNHQSNKLKYDINKLNPVFLRYHTWESSMEYTNYKIPDELRIYTYICEKVYGKEDHKHISWWNHDRGTAVIDLKIKGNNYELYGSIIQLSILITIIKEKRITAKKLANDLNINYSLLSKLLNGLMSIKLVSRSEGNRCDPELEFWINPEFSYDHKKISLISLIELKDATTNDMKLQMCKATLVSNLKKSKRLDIDDLKTDIIPKLYFELTDNIFNMSISALIRDGFIKYDGNCLVYVP